jgi:hypothetical protein
VYTSTSNFNDVKNCIDVGNFRKPLKTIIIIMIKKIFALTLISLFMLLNLSAQKICTIQKVNVDISGKEISFGPSTFPCKKIDVYKSAIRKAITSIFSDEFENKLSAYIKDSLASGEYIKAWEGITAKDVVIKMRKQINGEFLNTYGGLKGLWVKKFSGNLAYDGTMSGPIRINRIPLKYTWRDASSIANTIAHETAHRIGLTHPHSNRNLEVAYKEPPYVIGEIIEQIAREQQQN